MWCPRLPGQYGQAAHALPSPCAPASLGVGSRPTSKGPWTSLPLLTADPAASSRGVASECAGGEAEGEAGGLTLSGATQEEFITFGGIPDPVSEGRRMSCRLQDHPKVDNMQQRCAMRAAKLRDIEVTTGMSVNTSNSILHFSNNEIINHASQLGVSLGSNDSEISNSVNDILDLEAECALEMIRNLAVVRPMNDSDIEALGVRVLDNFCADLAPSFPESEEEDDTIEGEVVRSTEPGCEDRVEDQNKPKCKWKRKFYPTSAVRRGARIRTSKKFHDEI